jgi:rod shape-determining protein MreD
VEAWLLHVFVLALLVVAAVLLQTTVFQSLRVAGVSPNLILVLVVFFAISNGPRHGAVLGFVGGLVQDLLSGFYLGMNALSMALTGYIVGLGHHTLFRESPWIMAVITFVASLGAETVNYLLLLSLGVTILPGNAFFGVIIPVAVYNSAVAVLAYRRYYSSSTKGLLRNFTN